MNFCKSKRACAILFLAMPLWAQTPAPATPGPAPQDRTPQDRTPQVDYTFRDFHSWQPATVTEPSFTNSPRLESLMRAGQIYLSLQDAIALALENNLDLELERYAVRMAATDTLRATAGGTLRGVQLTVNESPAGVGGPGSPLITAAATGVTPQTSVPLNVTDTQLISESINNLAVTGTFPFSSGPALPLFDPVLSGQLQAQHLSTPQTSLAATGTPAQNTNNYTANAAYNQGFSTGTSISAGFLNQHTNQGSIRNLYNPFDTSSLGVTVTQPLMRGFGAELNRRFIRIAKNSEKLSDLVFKQQVISTVAGVIRLYNDLVSLNEDFKVKQQTLATAQRLLDDNTAKVSEGTLAPIEATRAQAQVAAARQDSINAEGYVRQQEIILKNVLTRDAGAAPAVHGAHIIPTDTIKLDPLPAETPDQLVAIAISNRPEFQAARLQLDNSQINLKGSRNSLLPQLDVVGTLQNNGLAGPSNPLLNPFPAGSYNGLGGTYGSALAQILKRDYPSYSVGINLTLPVRNRIAQADEARDELQVRQSEIRMKQLENQIRVEVEDALIAVRRTRAAYEAAVETRKLQEQSLAIEQEKFDVGLSTNFLVIQYQGFLAQARSTEVASLDAYMKARTQFERSIGLTLTNHNVSIEEAFKGVIPR